MILKGKCIEPKRTSVVLFMQRGRNTQIDNIQSRKQSNIYERIKIMKHAEIPTPWTRINEPLPPLAGNEI